MKSLKLQKNEFRSKLEDWIRSSGDVLLDLYYPHSASGGTLYLLNDPAQVASVIDEAEKAKYGDGTSILTAIRNKFYPLRGMVSRELIEQMRNAWPGGCFSIVRLDSVWPQSLSCVGDGETREELISETEALLTEQPGAYLGFGEHPQDTDNWSDRHDAEVIETVVGKLRK